MRLKNINHVVVLVLMLLVWAGCKKKRAFNEESGQATVDARMAQGENDEVVKDINIAIMEDFLLRGRLMGEAGGMGETATSICGVKLDTSKVSSGILVLNYTGVNCYGRTRSGKVKITVEGYPVKKWKHPGCSIIIEYLAYTVVRASDGKSIKLEGTQNIVNESGNTWFDLWYNSVPQVVYRLKGSDLKLTYDGRETATMSVDRRMTFTYANNVTTCRIDGMGSYGDASGLENWGQTTEGPVYTSRVISSPVWRTECGAMAPVAGEVWIKVEGKEFDLKCFYGTDDQGEAYSSACPFGWKVEWSRKKRTNTRIFGYY